MFRKIWEWIGHLSTIQWLWGGLAIVGGASTSLWAWISGQEPIHIFLLGLCAAALILLIVALIVVIKSEGFGESQSAGPAGWKKWRSTHRLMLELKKAKSDNANVKIRYYDQGHYWFAERVANSFELAGWQTNFLKSAEGVGSPHYEGIVIDGFNRVLAESVHKAFEQAGLSPLKCRVGKLEITEDNPKFLAARERINLFIGFEE